MEKRELRGSGYRLHSLVCHRGDLLAGHYVSDVYDHVRKRWRRFNDAASSQVTIPTNV